MALGQCGHLPISKAASHFPSFGPKRGIIYPNLRRLFFGDSSIGMLRPAAASPVTFNVELVLRSRCPSQVVQRQVQMISIRVSRLMIGRRWGAKEDLAQKAMDRFSFGVFFAINSLRKNNEGITSDYPMFKRATWQSVFMDRPDHISGTADLVWPAWNFAPLRGFHAKTM